MAAAEDLGLGSRSHNGFVFWGLSKPPRAQRDPVDRLQGIYERYAAATKAGLALATGDEGKRKQVRTAVERHGELLGKLIAQANSGDERQKGASRVGAPFVVSGS